MTRQARLIGVFGLILVLAGVLLLPSSHSMAAGCDPGNTGDGNDNGITCNDGSDGTVNGNGGNDTITNEGSHDGDIHGGDGNDTIINNGDHNGEVYGDDGDDTLINNDTWNLPSNNGEVRGGDGEDTIINNGTATNDIWGEDDNDTIIQNENGQVYNDLEGQNGDDTIINHGHVGNGGNEDDINGGNGNDTLFNDGDVDGDMDGGNHNDTITNEGSIGDDLLGGGGNDEITNCGTVDDDLNAGSGNDTVTLCGDADVGGDVNGGSHTDTLIFDFTSEDQSEIDEFNEALNDGNNSPGSGTVTWRERVFHWINFEEIVNRVRLLVTGGAEPVPASSGAAGAPPMVVLGLTGTGDVLPLSGDEVACVLQINEAGTHWLTPSDCGYDSPDGLSVMCMGADGAWSTSGVTGVGPTGDGKLQFSVDHIGMCGVFPG